MGSRLCLLLLLLSLSSSVGRRRRTVGMFGGEFSGEGDFASGNVLIARYLVGNEFVSRVGNIDHFKAVGSVPARI